MQRLYRKLFARHLKDLQNTTSKKIFLAQQNLSALKITKREWILTIHFYTPLYEKDIKEKQNRPMETTFKQDFNYHIITLMSTSKA